MVRRSAGLERDVRRMVKPAVPINALRKSNIFLWNL